MPHATARISADLLQLHLVNPKGAVACRDKEDKLSFHTTNIRASANAHKQLHRSHQ